MQIEQFIQQNRDAFDVEKPDERVWKGIERALDEAEKGVSKNEKTEGRVVKMSWNRAARLVAVAASLLLVGAMAGFYFGKNDGSKTGENSEIALQNVSPEAAEAEQFYVRSISTKTQQLAAYEYQNDQVEGDLAAIDRAMAELKTELSNVAPSHREAVVNALIENYQIKLKILERVLNHIETPRPTNQSVVDSLNIQKQQNHDNKTI